MPILILILTTVLVPLGALILNLYGNASQTTLEDVRLRATTLSLCNQRRHILESEIMSKNKALERIARGMDTAAAPCMAGGDVVLPPICRSVRLGLSISSATAGTIERAQDALRLSYPFRSRTLQQTLAKANEFSDPRLHGILRVENALRKGWAMNDGLRRISHGKLRRAYEVYFKISWPKSLEIDRATFRRANRFQSTFYPQRQLVGVNSAALNASRHSTWKNERAVAISRRTCEVAPGEGSWTAPDSLPTFQVVEQRIIPQLLSP